MRFSEVLVIYDDNPITENNIYFKMGYRYFSRFYRFKETNNIKNSEEITKKP
jgi:hypothetical protein